MGTPWTPERKLRQSELIRGWKPWEKSTGPRTQQGKEAVSQNAFKGGVWLKMRDLDKRINAHIRVMKAAGTWPPRRAGR